VKKLDNAAIDLFARKGYQGGPHVPQAGEANGVKVRRIAQTISDLSKVPVSELTILDVGCGEGVYSIELGLLGAVVSGKDARTERMDEGAAVAARHGLTNVTFEQCDVRALTLRTHGSVDVILCLGLLYHLEAASALSVLENLFQMCNEMLLIDTLIAPEPDIEVRYRDRVYEGTNHREHEDDDPEEVRRSRLLRSVDNSFSFRFTKVSLVDALRDTGFTSVFECHSPPEPGRPGDRITVVARKGEPMRIATYPWVNDLTERDIARRLGVQEGASSLGEPELKGNP
jgi:SAM-dependent methyltransferase